MQQAAFRGLRVLGVCAVALGMLWQVSAARPAAAQGMTTYPFGDGSGSIALPAGWGIESVYNGAVQASRGGLPRVDLGIGTAFWQPGTTANPNLSVPFGDPARSLAEALPRLFGAMGRVRVLGFHRRQPASWWPYGPAEYLDFEWTFDHLRLRSRAVVATADLGAGDGSWFFYYSMATAEASAFAREWPTLEAIWNSYYSRSKPEPYFRWDDDTPGSMIP